MALLWIKWLSSKKPIPDSSQCLKIPCANIFGESKLSSEYVVVEKTVLRKILKEVQEIQQELKELNGPKSSLIDAPNSLLLTRK